MSLRDQLNEDLNVLMNAEEMADVLEIENQSITGILSEDKYTKGKYDQYGTYVETKNLSIKKEDWEKIYSPSKGSVININSSNYKVIEKSESFELIKLKLEGNRS